MVVYGKIFQSPLHGNQTQDFVKAMFSYNIILALASWLNHRFEKHDSKNTMCSRHKRES